MSLLANLGLNFKKKLWLSISWQGLILILLIISSVQLTGDIHRLETKIEANRIFLQRMQIENEQVARLKKENQVVKPYLPKIDAFFLTSPDEVLKILTSLESIAKTTGNTVRINLAKEKPLSPTIKSLEYQVLLKGTLTNFIAFDQQLKKSSLLIQTNNVGLSAPAGLDKTGSMLYSLTLFLKTNQAD